MSLSMCSRHNRTVKSSGTSSPLLEYCRNTLPTSLLRSIDRNTSPHARWRKPGNVPNILPCVPLPLPGAPNSRIVLILSIPSVSFQLIQQLIPVVAPVRLVSKLANQSPHRFLVDAERGPGL